MAPMATSPNNVQRIGRDFFAGVVFMASAPGNVALGEGKYPHALAGCGEYRIRDGRSDRSDSRFTPAGGLLGGRHDMYLDPGRRFIHAQHPIIIEIALLDAPVF